MSVTRKKNKKGIMTVEVRLEPQDIIRVHLDGDVDIRVGRDPEWILAGKPDARVYGALTWIEDTEDGPEQRIVMTTKIIGYDVVVQEEE